MTFDYNIIAIVGFVMAAIGVITKDPIRLTVAQIILGLSVFIRGMHIATMLTIGPADSLWYVIGVGLFDIVAIICMFVAKNALREEINRGKK